jgi:hypothetical protein
MKRLTHIPLELLFWLTAIVALALSEPEVRGHIQHFTLCPLANLGIDWCWGCGLGRSITQILHGNISESLAHHWFGIPALVIIAFRMWRLVRLELRNYNGYKLI